MEKNRVNKYILTRLLVKEQNNREKNSMVDIYYELFDIYIYIYIYIYMYVCIHTHIHTPYIEEIDMNKKSNVSLICGSVNLKSKS